MFSTTLRISDDLSAFLRQAAKADALSVNAFLTALLERERLAARQRQLARDWKAYAAEGAAQDVGYALPAQAELAAESPVPYRNDPKAAAANPGPKGRRK